ncbi:Shikimate dehydrogenase substrate binding protein [Macrophomina phaseolina MS6]|uniref:Shikimate dehydrogenase substrate binding protein n=1 Tax=Macrophomina phaseolina (strain MS6) TaxID=1126212 RepID=K2QZB8_MACPH|nr:Shikimate dehydrogenase substrate binding protein [Macrophomina phaseolina MS6]
MHLRIFGADVASSPPPAMHNTAFKYLGMPHEYRLLQHAWAEDVRVLANDPSLSSSIPMDLIQPTDLNHNDTKDTQETGTGAAATDAASTAKKLLLQAM